MNLVEAAPKLVCTFNAADNTFLENYPWTDPSDKRHNLNAFVFDGSTIQSNIVGNRAGGASAGVSRYSFDTGAVPKKLQVNVLNTYAGAVNTLAALCMRISLSGTLFSQFYSIRVRREAAGTKSLLLMDETNAILVGAVNNLSAADFTKDQTLIVTDDGSHITASFGGVTILFPSTRNNTSTIIGVSFSTDTLVPRPSAHALKMW